MEKSALQQEDDDKSGFVALFTSIDWRYQLWKAGVTMTENVSREGELFIVHVFVDLVYI